MIRVIYDGNLGNRLFQYAFARILAERLGYRLEADPIAGFPRTAEAVDGEVHGGEPILLRGQKPDLSFLVDGAPERQIILTGYFQNASYYQPHKDKIRAWFTSDYPCPDEVSPRDVVVGVRRGIDYIPRHGLPMSYYIEALERIDFDQAHITTDSPNDPFVRQLARRYNAIVRKAGALDNFQFFRKFKKMVISNSTFLWWAAYLSAAEQIIFPRPSNGFWSSEDKSSKNIALEVPEARYEYLSCAPYRSEIPTEIARVFSERAIARVKGAFRPLFPFRKPAPPSSPWVFQESDD